MKLYSVYDKKAAAFSNLHPFSSDGLAVRDFTDAVREKDTALSKHPEDYSLWYIGEFDQVKGEFLNNKLHLVEAAVLAVDSTQSSVDPKIVSSGLKSV